MNTIIAQHLRVLGVDVASGSNYSLDDVKRAYHKQAKLYHPDKNRGLNEQSAADQFRKVKDAYDYLVSKHETLQRSNSTPNATNANAATNNNTTKNANTRARGGGRGSNGNADHSDAYANFFASFMQKTKADATKASFNRATHDKDNGKVNDKTTKAKFTSFDKHNVKNDVYDSFMKNLDKKLWDLSDDSDGDNEINTFGAGRNSYYGGRSMNVKGKKTDRQESTQRAGFVSFDDPDSSELILKCPKCRQLVDCDTWNTHSVTCVGSGGYDYTKTDARGRKQPRTPDFDARSADGACTDGSDEDGCTDGTFSNFYGNGDKKNANAATLAAGFQRRFANVHKSNNVSGTKARNMTLKQVKCEHCQKAFDAVKLPGHREFCKRLHSK